jgi:lytic cellulose monooxygenase (C1-hydroxylating)
MKKVTNATTDVGYGSGWFKISEQGLEVSTQTWAVTDLIANQGLQNIPIPSCIENGQYLLRAELIELHGASSSGGAQFYMECAQINVSGGSGAKTQATVSLPGAYSASDPGILIYLSDTYFVCYSGSYAFCLLVSSVFSQAEASNFNVALQEPDSV